MAAARAVVGRLLVERGRASVDEPRFGGALGALGALGTVIASPPGAMRTASRPAAGRRIPAGPERLAAQPWRSDLDAPRPGVGTIPPVRPWKKTGQRLPTASRTSSTSWPADSSTTTTPRSRSAAALSGPDGNGQRVIGRNSPTRSPLVAGPLDGRPGHPRGGAVGDHRDLGVVELLLGPADLALGDLGVRRLEPPVVAPRGPRAARLSERRTRGGRPSAPDRAQSCGSSGGHSVDRHDRLHRLAHDPVGEDHDRRPVALGELEGDRRRARRPRRSTTARGPGRGSRRARGPWSPGSSRTATDRCCRGPARRA